jgi:formyltetrahydrofolate hydrolase
MTTPSYVLSLSCTNVPGIVAGVSAYLFDSALGDRLRRVKPPGPLP